MHEVERAVERVIQTFHENYGEQITVDDMARTAMYSKFHFTRIFQRVTGLTPGRFLSAVRLQKAKQLLTDTSLKVTDISHMVGYTSVGTFSSRFGYSVGLPPTTYRQLGGFRPWKSVDHHRPAGARGAAAAQRSVIRGNIAFSGSAQERPVFIGLFAERIPRGQPIRCTVVHRPGPFALEDVPDGTWYVMACAENKERDLAHANGHAINGHAMNGHALNGRARNGNGRPVRVNGYATLVSDLKLARDQALLVGDNGPITVRNGMVRLADLRLRPMSVLDPPVVLALPDMRPEILAARAGSAA
jgi:AraC family transcriptional regulator